MPDQTPGQPGNSGNPGRPGDAARRRDISDISHHFLSGLRPEAPRRTPPTQAERPRDVAEFAQGVADEVAALAEEFDLDPALLVDGPTGHDLEGDGELPAALGRPVRAVVGAGLTGSFFTRGREYAAHLVRDGGRVGLVQIEASEIRLHLVEHDADPAKLPPERPRPTEGNLGDRRRARRIAEALAELDYDVDRWLVLLPEPRHPQARRLLADVGGCTVLATADNDGVIAGYKTIKHLADGGCPTDLSLALLDAPGDSDARRVHEKLADVCQQFLSLGLGDEGRVRPARDVAEHNVMWFRSRGSGLADDAAVPPAAPQWDVLAEFLAAGRAAAAATQAKRQAAGESRRPLVPATPVMREISDFEAGKLCDPAPVERPRTRPEPERAATAAPCPSAEATPSAAPDMPAVAAAGVAAAEGDDVIELAGADAAGIVRGYLARADLSPTAVTPPHLAAAAVAVDRAGRLHLVAAVEPTAHKLDLAAAARDWLSQSAAVVALALPGYGVDASAAPRLVLLVREPDAGASAVRHAASAGGVEVVPYRTVRWGGRVGLLLAA